MKGVAGEEVRATMSLWPSERAEVRRSRYKVAVDAEEDRRRREDNMVEICKSRRLESLLKKRRNGLPPSVAAAAPQMAHSSALQQKVYMFAEWYKPGCLLEYPLGGSGAIRDALVRGIEKFGDRLALCSHVENILIKNGRAVGVKLQSGQVPGSIIWRWLRLFVPEDAAAAF